MLYCFIMYIWHYKNSFSILFRYYYMKNTNKSSDSFIFQNYTPFPIYLSDNVFLDCKHAVGMMGTVVAVFCLSLSNCLDQI